MKRRLSVLLLVLILLVPMSAWGETSALPLAAPVDFTAQVEHLPGFEQEYEAWSLVSHETLALQEYVALNGRNAPNLAGFYFSVAGDEEMGLIIPKVHVFYKGSPALNVEAASFAVNGVRYDLTGECQRVQMGAVALEMLTVALDEDGMAFFRDVCSQQQLTLQLYGSKTYTTVLQLTAEPKNTADYVTNACLRGAASLLKTLNGALDHYMLWDLNEAYLGSKCVLTKTELAWAVNAEPFANDELGVLSMGDTGTAVKRVQEQLSARGFLAGPVGTQYNAQMQSAVRMAQQYYVLPVTGFADRALYECLLCDTPNADVEAEMAAGAELAAENVTLELNRFWLCDEVKAAHAQSTLGARSINSSDEVLVVADGAAFNTGVTAVNASETFRAQMEVNGVTYTGEVLFEKNGGALLQDSLDAQTENRVVVVVRVPAAVAENAAVLNLTLSAGEQAVTLELAK